MDISCHKKRNLTCILALCITFGFISLFGEKIITRNNDDKWFHDFQNRLKNIEKEAIQVLQNANSVDFYKTIPANDDVIYLTFYEQQLARWSNKTIGDPDLYYKLKNPRPLKLINGTYYEAIQRTDYPFEYVALIKIKDNKLFTNDYFTNQYATFFGIEEENQSSVVLSPSILRNGHIIYGYNSVPLLTLRFKDQYTDRSIHPFIVLTFIAFWIVLFIAFSRFLKYARNTRIQTYYTLGFFAILVLLRYIVNTYQIPASIFHLELFSMKISKIFTLSSVGDLFITIIAFCQILYIALKYWKIQYGNRFFTQYRNGVIILFSIITYLYTTLVLYLMNSIVNNSDVSLNLALIATVDTTSIMASIAILIGFIGLLIITDNGARIFHHFSSLKNTLVVTSSCFIVLIVLSFLNFNMYIKPIDVFAMWSIFTLCIINRYRIKKDIRPTINLLLMFGLSVFMVATAKNLEIRKEIKSRIEYATQWIEERDKGFEHQLIAFDQKIKNDHQLNDFLINYDEEVFKKYLRENVFNVVGYNFTLTISPYYVSSPLAGNNSLETLNEVNYFNNLIYNYGQKLENSNFYLINKFDGKTTYLACYHFNNLNCYIYLNAQDGSEAKGYKNILSRTNKKKSETFFHYSYGKYHYANLIASKGAFNYYYTLEPFGKPSEDVKIIEKDGFSHMIIPINREDTIVVSLDNHFFIGYYMNILYAFFAILLISSYGLVYEKNTKKSGSFKQRIKNRIIALTLLLFIMLTTLTIYVNKKALEKKQNYQSAEFLSYVENKLSTLNCVDARVCPEIQDLLVNLSDLLKVDINIYTLGGELVATSEGELFKYGFDSYLINPDAIDAIKNQGKMSFVTEEKLGNLNYLSAYMPIQLKNGNTYIINIPYFSQKEYINKEILVTIIIAINIAVIMMMIAFILAGVVAERLTRPLGLVNTSLKKMRIDGNNEKIEYSSNDELGLLVEEYNNLVEKLKISVRQLAKSERESAWREMARQIAHEIKNPLTPMKLNIQLLQRAAKKESEEEFKKRFDCLSTVLIEQIDNMAVIASTFSDFARIQQPNNEWFSLTQLIENSTELFRPNVEKMVTKIEPDIYTFADKKRMQRVVVNLLKNGEQSIPQDRAGILIVSLKKKGEWIYITVQDNGSGIPAELKAKIFEPNFTTKTSGTGLGLAISNSIITEMGGFISFESIIDKGTTFEIKIPCQVMPSDMKNSLINHVN